MFNGYDLIFKESTSSGYLDRTNKNASADATIAFAVNFESRGEIQTKNFVKQQGKIYIAIDANNLVITKERVEKIVNKLNQTDLNSLNIAGNSIKTLSPKLSQKEADNFCYEILKAVFEHENLKKIPTLIRSGGQTGFDESGIKAAMRLGIKSLVLAPKGWKFRNMSGFDISDEVRFKERFKF